MKRLFPAIILSAAVFFSSCSAYSDRDVSDKTEASEFTDTSALTTTKPVITENADFEENNSAEITEEITTAEAKQETGGRNNYYGEVNIPISYHSSQEVKGKVCREVIDEAEYEDFPAKEDIEPAIQYAYDEYFSQTEVWRDGTDEYEIIPCQIENLSFSSGLYLDFNRDGEKESLIVVENDSELPFSQDSIAVYYNGESSMCFKLDKLVSGGYAPTHIRALVYDDCIDLILEEYFGASGQCFTVYSYDHGFKEEFAEGKGKIFPFGASLCSYSFYNDLDGYPPHYFIRKDKSYVLVGKDEIDLNMLIDKIPEMQTIKDMIEDIYGTQITRVKTEGYINFYFYIGDEYIAAYIKDGNLCSPDIDRCRSKPSNYLESESWEGEIEYGMCLL